MPTVTLEDLMSRLPELIAAMVPGEQLELVQNGESVAILTRSGGKSWPCKAGSAKDKPHWMAPDFDAPLEDFREYM